MCFSYLSLPRKQPCARINSTSHPEAYGFLYRYCNGKCEKNKDDKVRAEIVEKWKAGPLLYIYIYGLIIRLYVSKRKLSIWRISDAAICLCIRIPVCICICIYVYMYMYMYI